MDIAGHAIIPLKAGYGFIVRAWGSAGAYNYALIKLRRNGHITDRGKAKNGMTPRVNRAVFTDAEILVQAYAVDGASHHPSTLHPRDHGPYQDGEIVELRFNDFGGDKDYNDLVVTIERFKGLDIDSDEFRLFAADLSRAPAAEYEDRDSLIDLGCLPAMHEMSNLVAAIDCGASVSAMDYDSLPEGIVSLNPEEKKLLGEDKLVAMRVFLEAREAVSATARLYTGSLHNGNADAFRHFYWNFRMARNAGIGPVWAERWGTAHEATEGNPSLEKAMDLFNNGKGRDFASTDVDDDARALRGVISNGSCRIIRNNVLIRSDTLGES